MKIFLPYRAEFGFLVMVHAPQVHHCVAQVDSCIVCCEAGNEALYPHAYAYCHIKRRKDSERRQSLECDMLEAASQRLREVYKNDACEFIKPDPAAPRKYFVPKPHYPIKLSREPDVVICPRHRDYGSDKNWEHWQTLADRLASNGLIVFAAGAPDSSSWVKTNGGTAWAQERFLDATIEAMRQAKLVVATDCGLAHLAILCGKPLLMISYKNGLVAPGHDDVGHDYWPIKMERYKRENHLDQPIHVLYDTWNDVDKVIDKTRSLLCES